MFDRIDDAVEEELSSAEGTLQGGPKRGTWKRGQKGIEGKMSFAQFNNASFGAFEANDIRFRGLTPYVKDFSTKSKTIF